MAQFVRTNLDPDGVASFHIDEKHSFKISGREIYDTKDKKEIALLKDDPNVKELSGRDSFEDFKK